VFERIGRGLRTLGELAENLGAEPAALVRLLNAGVALGLLEYEEDDSYRPAPMCETALADPQDAHYLGNWIRNMDFFRTAVADLDEAVLSGEPTVDPATHVGRSERTTREFALAMHDMASVHGRNLARFLPADGSRTLLDLGCGSGTYAFHIGMKHPHLALHLLDRAEILEVAREVAARFQLRNEVRYLAQDALEDEIPGRYDIVLVSNTLHMLGESASRELVSRLYDSVNPGGALVVQARFLNCRDCHTPGDGCLSASVARGPLRVHPKTGRSPVLLDLVQMGATSAGRNHSICETRVWLEEAGFEEIEYSAMTMFDTNSFLLARKGL